MWTPLSASAEVARSILADRLPGSAISRAMSTEKSPATTSGNAKATPPLALIAGPTGSGKSDVAVKIAQSMETQGTEAVIINADSAQVYRDLAVLSARPTEEEMQGIEHVLFGTWDGAKPCSAADWAIVARAEIAKVHEAGAYPILVGGTGLYMRTLLDGIAPVPEIDPDIRQAVRALSTEDAWAALTGEDPDRAAQLAPADSNRIARALEVVRSTGKPLSHWQARRVGGIAGKVFLRAAILLPDREALYQRCDARFANMLENGAIEEVEALLARNLDPDLPVMRAIGVPEIADYLRGNCTLEDTLSRGAQATRNYAKRQFTWFRHQPPPEWHRGEFYHSDFDDLIERLLQYLELT